MKYIVLVGDGMGDYPIEKLGNKTPLEKAKKPYMDYLASKGIVGLAETVPPEMVPESDTANLALMGYDPRVYSKGRSPLEAVSMGIEMQPEDTAFRCNIVTLSDKCEAYDNKIILDHSAGEINDKDAHKIIATIDKELGNDTRKFYAGVSYRHCLIWKDCPAVCSFTRPHDILGKRIGNFLPEADEYRRLMVKSFDILKNHPTNLRRVSEGKSPANSIWLWSNGKKPALPPFSDKFNIKAAAISAVDLIKGIAICAGMESIDVEGATGTLNTNYHGKAKAAIDALGRNDLVYIHVEAPDECGHRGEAENKVLSIEYIDGMLGFLMDEMKKSGQDYKILLCCDHPTPIELRTHSHEPIPFVIYQSNNETETGLYYSEEQAKRTGLYIKDGSTLINLLIK
ncbi:MAG: cofactor-independent phosphoglycerate mutase [Clostridiales bacterium GWF2_38_85]|nr:MAG: cofactor-independent phosphoglycerate mutase [Clostridiales bacterium GWF2_38_85]HBL83950.1 cofactor-independent phosphoglycerate mutase [Clostridiales bacterium]